MILRQNADSRKIPIPAARRPLCRRLLLAAIDAVYVRPVATDEIFACELLAARRLMVRIERDTWARNADHATLQAAIADLSDAPLAVGFIGIGGKP